MSGSEAARPGGIFDRLGNFVVRWPLLVIAFWIALAALPAMSFPPLMEMAAKSHAAALPDDAPTMATAKDMGKSFHETGESSQVTVVLTDENGLGPADLVTYTKLVDKLHQEPQDKMSIQDFITTPALHEILASKDNKAWNLPLSFPAEVTDPLTQAGYRRVQEIVKQTLAGSTLAAHYAGPVASIADLNNIGQEDGHLVEIATAVSVLVILMIVYRNLIAMLVPLTTIGLSVVTAQGVVSGLAELGLAVQPTTVVFMSAVTIGAGTDYAVFLISRYHDYVRKGVNSDQAVKNALMSIGKVIAASAATVAITFLVMVFAQLSVFSSVGPAVSVSIVVGFFAAVTLLPAILVLIGRRGWIKPRKDLTHRLWRVTGTRIVRRPWIHLVASLIVLVILASCTTLVRFNYDDTRALPSDAASVAGYNTLDRHYPQNLMTPMVLFIKSQHDLRTPAALADLEQMASRVSQLPDITAIRGLTRPNGEPLQQTKVSYQAGEVGSKLDQASSAIHDHGGDLDKLVDGSNKLADALAQVRDQVTGAVSSAGTLVTVLTTMKQLIGADKTLNALAETAQLAGRMRTLGNDLSSNMVDVANTVAWASPMVTALDASPVCNADPACVSSRAQLRALVQAKTSGTLGSITALAHDLQQTQEMQTVGQTVDKLEQNLNQAVSTLQSIGGLQTRISQTREGANALAQGSHAISQGVQELVNQTKKMGAGLNEASSFLLTMKHDAEKPSMAGFNIPAQVLGADEFKKAAVIFMSPDGHAARYLIQSALKPFTTAAMDQVTPILNSARSAQPNSELSDASISLAGIPGGLRDTKDYYNNDIVSIVLATIIIVFLILVILLRAIVAPLYLIGSVLVSFLSAMGLGVIFFQLILGMDLHWSLPGLCFILLVAVGADYNMLLISRIRDESPHGVRVGVIRTVGSTGAVITSAGLIFAASMFGLLAASISTMIEAGFIIGSGILIDTFLVRTITVPALAALIGQKNWWPSKLGDNTSPRRRVYPPSRRVYPPSRVRKASRGRHRTQRGGARIMMALSQLDRLKANLIATVKANLIPKTHISASSPSTVSVTPVNNGHGSDDVREATSDFPITINGNDPIDDPDSQALPLSGPIPLSPQLIKRLRLQPEYRPAILRKTTPSFPIGNGHTNGTSHTNGNGTNGTNGNGSVNGNGHTNGNGKDPIDDLDSQSLPVIT